MPDRDNAAIVRPMPFPYRAMLAICSDLDETPDRQVYWEIARFLNTTADTTMGPGVGLEVGNTIYFDMPPDQFAYWNTDDAGREMVRALIRSGHIDCLHSFGDLATTRAHAGKALDELARHDCRLEAWVDHAVAPTNFGADIMRGRGDLPGADAYHADLTCDFGVRYVWRGRVTSVIGQNAGRSLRGIFNAGHPLQSARTLAKEAMKGVLARRGDAKYAMHGPNRVLAPCRLRDGRDVWEFIRCNPYYGGVQHAATAAGLASVLTRRTLDRLVERQGVCVLYTHLGKIRDRGEIFAQPTRDALRLLADYHRRGLIQVTTTRRLLGFRRAMQTVLAQVAVDGANTRVELNTGSSNVDECDLDGLTVYLPHPGPVQVAVNGREIAEVQQNAPDHTGWPSVSLPWPPLKFPEI